MPSNPRNNNNALLRSHGFLTNNGEIHIQELLVALGEFQ